MMTHHMLFLYDEKLSPVKESNGLSKIVKQKPPINTPKTSIDVTTFIGLSFIRHFIVQDVPENFPFILQIRYARSDRYWLKIEYNRIR